MKPATYPFSAIVGQEQMKLALLLAAVDWRLGALLRGDKGAGKTTTARALAVLLPEPAPFVNLPIGITEDRLLGGLHLESTLKGNPSLKPGLLSEAHEGVLYIDEVNLLPAHLGDALLDAAASGIHVVEREGFSVSHPAEFVLLGSMNPEEGLLRPQLLDRFALSVDISAPLDPQARRSIVERRIAFERNPVAFAEEWSSEQDALRGKIRKGREQLPSIDCPGEILTHIGSAICEAGVRSLRADLAVLRASIACAALMGDSSVELSHVESVLPLVLNHRARTGPRSSPPPSQPPRQQEQSQSSEQQLQGVMERIFSATEMQAPALRMRSPEADERGNSQSVAADSGGLVIGTRRTETPRELDIRATLHRAVLETGTISPRISDVHEKVRAPRSSVRYLFLIDSSGSHAAQEKMRLVKGAALSLLHRSFKKGDEVAIIVFRGSEAQVLLEPSRQVDDAATALEYLPTGGRTPLAHALELAKNYLTPSTLLIVMSDGRANVAVRGGEPWQESLEVARQLRCRAIVVDTENPESPVRRSGELANALSAPSMFLAYLENLDVLEITQ